MHKTKLEKQERRRDRGLYRVLERNHNNLPILSVHKTNKHIYIYVNKSDYSETLMSFMSKGKNMQCANLLAKDAAKKMNDNGISRIVFNKNGYKFHGTVKSVYDTIKEVGIQC